MAGAVLAGLVACGTTGGGKKAPTAGYEQWMAGAEAQIAANAFEEALRSFDAAAKADPTRKEPWVRSAQLHFDTGNYGRAIVAAEEALARDPSDKVADSVLTLGGLRLANRSLRRLQDSGGIASEAARNEARQLANTMRPIIGEDRPAASGAAARQPAKAAPRRRTAAPASQPAPAPAARPTPGGASDPFSKLGGN